MNSLLTLWRWTFRETVRDRILWGYGVFAVLLLLGLFAVGKVPWGETHIIVGQLGYSAIAAVSQVLVALLAAFQLGRDVERRVHYMILGRDIPRSQYLLGRYAGLFVTASLVAVVLVVLLLALNTWQAPYRPPLWSLLAAIPAIMLQMAMILSIAFLLYQATTSATLAMVLTLLTLVVGRSVASVQEVLATFGEFPRLIGRSAAFLFPNLELITFNDAIIYEKIPPIADILIAASYGLAYAGAVLGLSVWLLNRKEL